VVLTTTIDAYARLPVRTESENISSRQKVAQTVRGVLLHRQAGEAITNSVDKSAWHEG
jgi:hypothetical protein